jgi:hypothetical protein
MANRMIDCSELNSLNQASNRDKCQGFPLAALTLAHLALAAAAIFALAVGLIVRRFLETFEAGSPEIPCASLRCFAQRNLCAAAILARAEGLSFLRPPCPLVDTLRDSSKIPASSCSRASICSRIATACFSC